MIIDNFYIFCACIRPTKADSPLIVDTNAVLTRTITFERFKIIAGRRPQIINSTSDFKLSELASCNPGNIYELPDVIAF